MIANTKDVRRVMRLCGVCAEWTDKCSKDANARIVVAVVGKQGFEEVRQFFADCGYTNKVYFTGGRYLRVKTQLVA